MYSEKARRQYSGTLHRRGGWLTVVGERADHLDDESASADGGTAATNTKVGVFPQEAGVFLMNADDVLDHERRSVMLGECSGLPSTCVSGHFSLKVGLENLPDSGFAQGSHSQD